MNTANHLIRGAVWMVSLRWAIRGLGLVRTVVLARLLAPDDFGVFAIALVVLGFILFLSEGGIEFALIREQQAERAHFDSAWTMQIILGLLTGGLIFASAPIVAHLFNEPRATLVVQIIALRPAFNAFNNIGVVYFLKDFDFGKEFKFGIVRDLIDAATTIVLAVVLANYLALAIGMVAGAGLATAFSYIIHPYRPRISFKKTREILSFSGWLVISNAAEQIGDLVDRTVIGAIAASSVLGIYQMATMLGSVIMFSTISPLWRGLFPSYSRLANDPAKLTSSFYSVFAWVAIVGSVSGFGVAAVADDLVIVVLGDKWAEAGTLVPWITMSLALAGIGDAPVLVLMALGHARLSAVQSLIRLSTLVIAMPLAGLSWGTEGVAIAFFGASLLNFPIPFQMVATKSSIRWPGVVAHLWRPAVSGAVMFIVVRVVGDMIHATHAVALAAEVAVGAVTFVSCAYLLWAICGRPEGPEATLLDIAAERLSLRRAD